jgi:hypothetical protein
MAAVESFVSNSTPFHHRNTMVTGSGKQPPSAESQYRQRSRSRAEPAQSPGTKSNIASVGTPPTSTNARAATISGKGDHREDVVIHKGEPLSPPRSASPHRGNYKKAFSSQKNFSEPSSTSGQAPKYTPEAPKLQSVPLTSPPSTSVPLSRSTPTPSSLDDVQQYGGNIIKVRDLAHIQEFASEEFLSFRGQSGRRRTADDLPLKYEISGMPIADIIEMVAGLLTKITTTNDRQHENLHRPIPPTGDSSNLSGLSSSVLAFHGKNVPSITILSYLSRIHKYCPTTYEVFLSLLVYFDRMTERVNADPMQAIRRGSDFVDVGSRPSTSYSASGSDLADSPTLVGSAPEYTHDPPSISERNTSSEQSSGADLDMQSPAGPSRDDEVAAFPLSHFFVVDSFNIHRLVIAGVTCASKFFSDVFYTNSRYAKVCSFSSLFKQELMI